MSGVRVPTVARHSSIRPKILKRPERLGQPHHDRWGFFFIMQKRELRRLLSACYADTPNKVLAERLGVSFGMVMRYAYQLGLRKDPKYLSDTNRKCGMKSSVAKIWKCNN